MSVRVGPQDFDVGTELAQTTAHDLGIGGIALFIGKVRQEAHGEALRSLTIEHYPEMTESELERIEVDACQRFSLSSSRIVHRVGELKPGDNIVLVIATAPHRQNAFAAAGFLMDYLKTRAPFWKKETAVSGKEHWVEARPGDDDAADAWSEAT